MDVDDRVNTTKALNLNPVSYLKANLGVITKSCSDLTITQQAKLLSVLEQHETLIQGMCGEWKGCPISIKIMDGAQPIWAKQYQLPLKTAESSTKKILPMQYLHSFQTLI